MENGIRFKPKIDKIIETILYLARHLDELDAYKIVKLVYLADREHLNIYGRPITYDKMVAMKNGPVASTTYDIIKQNKRLAEKIDFSRLPFELVNRGDREYVSNPTRPADEKILSVSDRRVLEWVVKEHGAKTFGQLYDITHAHKAYAKAWNKRGDKRSRPILVEDMIEESEDKKSLVEELRFTGQHVL